MKTNSDKYNLRQVILDFPDQFEEGFKLAKNLKISKDFNSVCISGMGGSSLPADIVKAYVKNLREKDARNNKNFFIYKNRGYKLPLEAYENCLNIFSSYSGNTEETLSSFNEALKNNLPSLGLSHGGKLIEACQKNNIPYIIIPKISQPRYALGYFFSILLQLFFNGGLIQNPSQKILESIKQLKNVTADLELKGETLAKKLKNTTPIIHTTARMKSVGRVWKIKINENAKTPCFFNYYSELNHNEMLGYTLPQAKFYLVTLRDKKDNPRIAQRMDITSTLLKKQNSEVEIIDIPDNKNFFLKTFSSLALADWTSYYLALNYDQDPTPVAMVENFKKLLAKN